jgi:hypothetical protein
MEQCFIGTNNSLGCLVLLRSYFNAMTRMGTVMVPRVRGSGFSRAA